MRGATDLWERLSRRIAAASPLARDELIAGALASVLLLVLSTLLVLRFVARLPADHFIRPRARSGNRAVAALHGVARNLGGLLLVAAGAVMALPGVPGPGLAAVLVGFLLLDFPGKRALELRLLRRPRLRRALEALRARHRQPPLLLDLPGDTPSDGSGAPPTDR